jgi:hypothetical protein
MPAPSMVLGWPGAEVVGITTTADPDGQRADYVVHFLGLVGRDDIPVAAGAGASLSTGESMGGLPNHEEYWGSPVAPRPAPPGAAIDLIDRSIDLGATIAAVGPYTNLALLESARPGRLNAASIVVTLLLLCCHPSLTPVSQMALTLRAVGGLSTAEIARAFLVPEATVASESAGPSSGSRSVAPRSGCPGGGAGRTDRRGPARAVPDRQRGVRPAPVQPCNGSSSPPRRSA